MTRTFKIAECCLNCIHRDMRIEKNIICQLDNEWYSERVVCSEYKRTEKKQIITQEAKLLPKGK